MKTPFLGLHLAGMGEKMSVITRSIFGGFCVSTIGIAIWSADIYFFRLSLLPVISMVIPLWLYWKFFSGQFFISFWPSRKVAIRNVALSFAIWKWGLLAGLLFVVIIQSAFVITFRLIPLPASFSTQYKIIETLPTSIALLAIFMSSLVAGVCEEVGFRGYMQVPLEKRFGPAVAITVVSIIFSLIHLDRSWALPVLPVIFFASGLLGILAYQSQSLLPGIIGHIVLDVFDYSFWWTTILGKFNWQTIFVTGIDSHFLMWVTVCVAATLGFIISIKKLGSGRKLTRFDPVQ